MSQQLIHEYLAELDKLRKISGGKRETIVREALKALLKFFFGHERPKIAGFRRA